MSFSEHEKCYRAGIIQRDISDYNIIISNGEGHLIDFDCSKVTQRFQPQVNGDHQRIEESFRQLLPEEFEESVISRAEEIMGSSGSAKHYLTGLLVNNVHTRPLSFNDLGWCEEVCVCVLLRNLLMCASSFMIFPHPEICVTLG